MIGTQTLRLRITSFPLTTAGSFRSRKLNLYLNTEILSTISSYSFVIQFKLPYYKMDTNKK